LYWQNIRPVPLTEEEVKGYRKSDSLAVVERKKEVGDTVKVSKHRGFQPWDILMGDSYKVGKHSNFKIHMPLGGFNTVEGFNLIYRLSFGTIVQDTNKTRLTFTPTFRYAFACKVLSGTMRMQMRNKNHNLTVEGGRYVSQYNIDKPISPIVNDITTLLLEKNLMKLYERRFAEVNYQRRLSGKLSLSTRWTWAKRYELFNNSSYKLVDVKSVEDYTPNRPVNVEMLNTAFNNHEALTGSFALSARPWLKYAIRNGVKREIGSSSPTFRLEYKKGFSDVLGSDVNFDLVELGVRHAMEVGARGKLDVSLRGGKFINHKSMYFMDYAHFLGNRTPFTTSDPVGSFRLLDYYAYSTADQYFKASAHYHFRKFLLTQFTLVRMTGVRENVFVNYLATPSSRNYTEVGYSIDGILRLFRVEVAAALQQAQYQTYGFRIGLSTNVNINIED